MGIAQFSPFSDFCPGFGVLVLAGMMVAVVGGMAAGIAVLSLVISAGASRKTLTAIKHLEFAAHSLPTCANQPVSEAQEQGPPGWGVADYSPPLSR